MPSESDAYLHDAALTRRLETLDKQDFLDVEGVAEGDITRTVKTQHLDAGGAVLDHTISFEGWS